MYDGKARLSKHSLYQDFLKDAEAEELNYFVFAVLRNPMEMVVTGYEKMKANAKETLQTRNFLLKMVVI